MRQRYIADGRRSRLTECGFSRVEINRPRPEKTVLVLQGGGALGAYQAGAYDALAAAGQVPEWVAGVSIGAINAALIAATRLSGEN